MANTKKLSVATVCGAIDLKKLIAAPNSTLKLMRVIGLAVGTKQGHSSYGEWTSLLGQFEAVNIETGETHSASTLFLPDVALLPIQIALSQEGTKGVEFAIELSAKYSENKKPGGSAYEYVFETLLPPDQNDPISRMKARLLALAAPESAAAPAAAPAPAPAPATEQAPGPKGKK